MVKRARGRCFARNSNLIRKKGHEMSDDGPITPPDLLRIAYRWSNISKDQLVAAGVIGAGVGGSDWKRFNSDPMTFVMKLPRDKLPALCKLINT